MAKLKPLLLAALLCGCSTTGEPPARPGKLTIVGGGLSADNAEVWSAFIDSAQGNGPIVIIPAASGYPTESADGAAAAMTRHGVKPSRISTARLAVMDDPTTDDVDESDWSTNATDADTVALLRSASAVWFTGGDQRRITELLLDTPALAAIRDAHARGAGIGGTSAGAAMMSDPMITGGFRDESDSEPLTMDQGLGFLSDVIVDQHFSERGRLWRLTEAVERYPTRLGLGVDEDTALVGSAPDFVVLGRGTLTVVRDGKVERIPPGHAISLPESP